MPNRPAESLLTIHPAGGAWGALLRREWTAEQRRFREQLGLPTDRPVIMTGHHTVFWHPGILAKYLAADAAAVTFGAEPVWLVVDQDRAGTFELRYPVRKANRRLGEARTEFEGRPREAGAAVTERDGLQPDDEPALASVAKGIARAREAMRRLPSVPPYAMWQTRAVAEVAAPLRQGLPPPRIVLATAMAQTDLFTSLLGRMGREPEACIDAYNAAVARHPRAGMRPLLADPVQDRWELPLWRLPREGERRHVYAEELASIPREELAPKALLMTGLMRLAGCDLFIHGFGGGGALDEGRGQEGYDVVAEEWLRAWLGVEIAPQALVTATLRLPLMEGESPTEAQVARAVWLAHHARHNPDVLRDAYAADAKAKLIARMCGASRVERHDLFKRMHTVLDEYRRNHAGDLADLDGNAAEVKGRVADAAIAGNRTWAFPLFPAELLGALRSRIDAEFGASH